MNVELLTMNGGNGTLSASYALASVLGKNGATCRVTDVMSEVSGLGHLLGETYNFLISTDLRLASTYMKFAHTFPIDKVDALNSASGKKLANLFKKRSPDLVVLVCPWISGMVHSAILTMKGKRPKVAVVVVDFGPGVTESWLDLNADLTIFPTKECADHLLKGCKMPVKAEILGMPVHPEFYSDIPSKKKAKELMDMGDRSVTILGGREGGMFNITVLKTLLANKRGYELVVQCGRNSRLRKKVNDLGARSLGFVPSVRDLMIASDVVITKPGALTLAELITLRSKFVVNTYPSIMPQEWGNAVFVRRHNLAPVCPDPSELPKCVVTQLENKKVPNNMDLAGTERIAKRLLRLVDQ